MTRKQTILELANNRICASDIARLHNLARHTVVEMLADHDIDIDVSSSGNVALYQWSKSNVARFLRLHGVSVKAISRLIGWAPNQVRMIFNRRAQVA